MCGPRGCESMEGVASAKQGNRQCERACEECTGVNAALEFGGCGQTWKDFVAVVGVGRWLLITRFLDLCDCRQSNSISFFYSSTHLKNKNKKGVCGGWCGGSNQSQLIQVMVKADYRQTTKRRFAVQLRSKNQQEHRRLHVRRCSMKLRGRRLPTSLSKLTLQGKKMRRQPWSGCNCSERGQKNQRNGMGFRSTGQDAAPAPGGSQSSSPGIKNGRSWRMGQQAAIPPRHPTKQSRALKAILTSTGPYNIYVCSTVRHQNQKLMSAFDDVKCKWISRDHDQEAHLVRQSATALKRDNK